jgi:hypothetical protein
MRAAVPTIRSTMSWAFSRLACLNTGDFTKL